MDNLNPEQENLLTNASYLYENSPCGHLSFYPGQHIFQINQTLLNWIGLRREEVINLKKFQDLITIGGKMYYQMVVLPLLNRQGFLNEINFDVNVKNNKPFPCLFNAFGIKGEDGKTVAVHATILKITDRKQYESELLMSKKMAEEERKRFESLSNIIPEIIWTALSNGNVNFMNERFFEYFNCTDTVPRKTSLLHIIHQNQSKKVFRTWVEAVQKGEKFEAEVLLKKQGELYEWFLVRAVPYRNENELIEMWFGSCTNINEHKTKQEQKVQSLSNSLSAAGEIISTKDKTLNDIAYSQSHLVRRPLANIIGLVEMLESTEEANTNNSIVLMLKQSAAELDKTIKDIVYKV
ncbi:MAG: PAS domain-containing protein [Sphingobacteriaceae bacterium]|nr:MAG: PAS domain-containing protein [Sphingobacteriaceae bacterium]